MGSPGPVPARLFTVSRTSDDTAAASSHRNAATSSLPFIQGVERGRALGCRNDFLIPSRTWCLKFTDASWACITLSSRTNSSVTLSTNTQAVSGRRARVNVTNTFFKIGRVSPDAIWRARFVGVSLGQCCCDVRLGKRQESPCINSHKTCFPSYPSLGVTPMAVIIQEAKCVTRRHE